MTGSARMLSWTLPRAAPSLDFLDQEGQTVLGVVCGSDDVVVEDGSSGIVPNRRTGTSQLRSRWTRRVHANDRRVAICEAMPNPCGIPAGSTRMVKVSPREVMVVSSVGARTVKRMSLRVP